MDNNNATASDSTNVQSVGFDYSNLDSRDSVAIKLHVDAIKKRIQRANRDIVEIGEMLIDVKERLPHGQFGLWLEAEFSWDERTARRFMSVAAMFKSDTVSDLDCIEKGTLNIAAGALYILAANSTPEEIRREVLERAYNGEQFTQAEVKRMVAQSRASCNNKKTRVEASAPTFDENFVVGDWVEVRTRGGNVNWDGLQGVITRVEQHEITVQLNDSDSKYLRFYRDELIKIAPHFFKTGNLVLIDCPKSAATEDRKLNGCWGVVASIGRSGSVEVVVKGQVMRFKQGDLDPIDKPDADFKHITEKINRLLQRDDLDESERYWLEAWFCKRLTFSDRQVQILDDLVKHYEGTD